MVRIRETISRKVSAFVQGSISSRLFFLTALASLPAFLLMESVPVKAVLTGLYVLFFVLLGKRFLLIPAALVFVSIVALNLFSPAGRVLLSLGPIALTQGALHNGLHKAVTFIGLIYLSRVSVRRDLTFPGKLGAMLSRTFFYFDLMSTTWNWGGTAFRRRKGGAAGGADGDGGAAKAGSSLDGTIPAGSVPPGESRPAEPGGKLREGLIDRLDAIFRQVSEQAAAGPAHNFERARTNWKGWLYAVLFAAVHWGVFAFLKLRGAG